MVSFAHSQCGNVTKVFEWTAFKCRKNINTAEYIFFNDELSIKNFTFTSTIGEIECVTNPACSKYFKYMAYCCARNRSEKHGN